MDPVDIGILRANSVTDLSDIGTTSTDYRTCLQKVAHRLHQNGINYDAVHQAAIFKMDAFVTSIAGEFNGAWILLSHDT